MRFRSRYSSYRFRDLLFENNVAVTEDPAIIAAAHKCDQFGAGKHFWVEAPEVLQAASNITAETHDSGDGAKTAPPEKGNAEKTPPPEKSDSEKTPPPEKSDGKKTPPLPKGAKNK